jgi:hypothetical protein
MKLIKNPVEWAAGAVKTPLRCWIVFASFVAAGIATSILYKYGFILVLWTTILPSVYLYSLRKMYLAYRFREEDRE